MKKTGFRFYRKPVFFCALGDEVAVDVVEEQCQYHAHEADLHTKQPFGGNLREIGMPVYIHYDEHDLQQHIRREAGRCLDELLPSRYEQDEVDADEDDEPYIFSGFLFLLLRRFLRFFFIDFIADALAHSCHEDPILTKKLIYKNIIPNPPIAHKLTGEQKFFRKNQYKCPYFSLK